MSLQNHLNFSLCGCGVWYPQIAHVLGLTIAVHVHDFLGMTTRLKRLSAIPFKATQREARLSKSYPIVCVRVHAVRWLFKWALNAAGMTESVSFSQTPGKLRVVELTRHKALNAANLGTLCIPFHRLGFRSRPAVYHTFQRGGALAAPRPNRSLAVCCCAHQPLMQALGGRHPHGLL
jgi:hypothetical protein